MQPNRILILSAQNVTDCLDMNGAIDAMRKAFCQVSMKKAEVPLRAGMEISEHNGNALFMPAYLPESKKIVLKVVTTYKDNAKHGLHAIHALVQLFNAETGEPLAVMDGEVLTALRTGAASGVATETFSNPEAKKVAIIGAGIQGRTQLEAVCCVRNIKEAMVIDLSDSSAKQFADEMSQRLSIPILPATINDLSTVDIICTATPSSKPLFDHGSLKKGVHINAIGGFRPNMCEIPAETVKNARVFVDQKEACLAEAGDLIQPLNAGIVDIDHINTEIGEVLIGKKPGRCNPEEITFFKSVGIAAQDLAVADLIFEKAKEIGLGTFVEI